MAAPAALALVALLAVVGASAREPGGGAGPASVRPAIFVQNSAPRCAGAGLDLCGPGLPDQARAGSGLFAEPRQEAAPLTRWTRLAGMFMGRVDAVRLKRCRVRINLEIR